MLPTIDTEIGLARADGVTHPANLPFLLTVRQPSLAVLLVHGFGSTPHEMRALGERLQGCNCCCFGVRLPGHGTSPEDLAGKTVEDWQAAVERGYRLLKGFDLPISAVGISTGSLLLAQLALRQSLAKLILLSPYLKLQHPLAALAGLLRFFIPYHHREIAAEQQPFFYAKRPLQAIAQLNRLRTEVAKLLPQIKTPTLVVASRGDKTIAPGTAEEFYSRLGSREKTIYSYDEKAPHALTTQDNPYRDDLFNRIGNFLTDLNGSGEHL